MNWFITYTYIIVSLIPFSNVYPEQVAWPHSPTSQKRPCAEGGLTYVYRLVDCDNNNCVKVYTSDGKDDRKPIQQLRKDDGEHDREHIMCGHGV